MFRFLVRRASSSELKAERRKGIKLKNLEILFILNLLRSERMVDSEVRMESRSDTVVKQSPWLTERSRGLLLAFDRKEGLK